MSKTTLKREQLTRVLGEDLLKRASADGRVDEIIPLRKVLDDLGLMSEEAAPILTVLEKQGWILRDAQEWRLTRMGWEHGRSLLRAHRIYESYLAENTGLDPAEWHAEADRIEHILDPETVNHMADELHRPRFDPHGDAIPTRRLETPDRDGQLLPRVEADGFYRILHIEDEPGQRYQRLVSAGLAPEIILDIQQLNGGRFLVKWAGREHILDSAQAAALVVQPCDPEGITSLPDGNLLDAKNGEEVIIHSLSPAERGLKRRRLLDLGFVAGSRIVREGSGAFHGPIRFRVRGTIQALRPEQAKNIFTRKEIDCPSDLENTKH